MPKWQKKLPGFDEKVIAHWPGEHGAAALWQTYVQLTEAEAAFRTMKSEIKVRPIWHQLERRVEAHIMIAFLGYAMHVCLKKLAAKKAPSLTSWQVLQQLRKIVLVDVEFDTTDGRRHTLPRITIPEKKTGRAPAATGLDAARATAAAQHHPAVAQAGVRALCVADLGASVNGQPR